MTKLEQLIKELCPKGVEYKQLNNVSFMQRGTSITKAQSNKGIYPVISGGKEPAFYCDVFNREGETITVAGSGAGAGYVQYWQEPIFVCDAFSIKGSDSIITKYMYYYLQSKQEYIYSTKKGGGVPHVHISSIDKMKLPVPPIEVQAEIVKILDEYTESVTALQQELENELTARKKQYEYYSSRLFLDTNAPEIEMSELADFVYGYTDTAKDVGDTRFVRITDINEQGYLKQEDQKYITMTEDAKKSILRKGDIIMARTGATFGKVLYFDSDFPSVYASFLIKIIPNEKILSRYYWHFTKTSLYWEQAKKLVTTGGQPQFNTPAVKKIRIPIPPIKEQERIVSILDRFDKLCNDISEGLPAEIEARRKQYEYYRDKLLSFEEV